MDSSFTEKKPQTTVAFLLTNHRFRYIFISGQWNYGKLHPDFLLLCQDILLPKGAYCLFSI